MHRMFILIKVWYICIYFLSLLYVNPVIAVFKVAHKLNKQLIIYIYFDNYKLRNNTILENVSVDKFFIC